MSFARRSFFGAYRPPKVKHGRSIDRDFRARRLRLEPLEDRSLLSVGVGGVAGNDVDVVSDISESIAIDDIVSTAHRVNRVVVTELKAWSNNNGVFETTDKMLITWAVAGVEQKPTIEILVGEQKVSAVYGPYDSTDGAYMYAGVFGPLPTGKHSFTINSTDATGDKAIYTGTFDVAAGAASTGPEINRVVVAEAFSGSDRDGVMENTDKLVVTWNVASDAGVALLSLEVAGRTVKVGGPNADSNCYGVFGPLAAGSYDYTIAVADGNGVVATRSGTFDVAGAAVAQPSITNIVAVEAKRGSDGDGLLESTDRVLVTWRENDVGAGATRSLIVDGQAVAAIGAPNADNCCYGVFGPLAAGSHPVSIVATTAYGATAEAAGYIVVADPIGPPLGGGTTTVIVGTSNLSIVSYDQAFSPGKIEGIVTLVNPPADASTISISANASLGTGETTAISSAKRLRASTLDEECADDGFASLTAEENAVAALSDEALTSGLLPQTVPWPDLADEVFAAYETA
ncbi:MAG: hypothetical protein JW959_08580 [Pirellulales bacterium]|nr:hypothetical protein [Pirellulales bacterium]